MPSLNAQNQVIETPDLLQLLRDVNHDVNQFRYATDISRHAQEDYWTSRIEEFNAGDCDDYTLSKRKRLMDAGVPAECMFPTICTVNGDGHLVLVVRTDHADLVLDNIEQTIKPVSQVRYVWLSRLDPVSNIWVSMR